MAQATPISQIRQLQAPDGTVNVFPITIEEAIHDSDGVQLSTKLADIPDMIETETSPIMDALVDTTVEGNPINFTTKAKQDAVSTKITLDPIQDLHGYDKPWVGGAGKNLLPMTVESLKAVNDSGTWSGNTYTLVGVTFTILTDSDGNIIGVEANGTPSSSISFILQKNITSEMYPNQMILNGCPSGGASSSYKIRCKLQASPYTVIGNDYGSGINITIPDDNEEYAIEIRIQENYTANNLIFRPMIRLATESDATFEPYTNICPISGRTEVKANGCGKNLLQNTGETKESNGVTWTVNNDGTITVSGTATDVSTFIINSSITLKPSIKKITLSGLNNVINIVWNSFALYGSNNNLIVSLITTGLNQDNQNHTFDLSSYENVAYAMLSVKRKSNGVVSGIIKPMIEAGDVATEYEPYQSSNDLTISLGQTVYGGTVDVEKGELVVDRKFKTLDGTYLWRTSEERGYLITSDNSGLADCKYAASRNTWCLSNLFPRSKYTWTDKCFGIENCKIWVEDANFQTFGGLDEFKAYLNSNPLQVVYELATPTVIPLTPAQVHLLKGINVISTDGDDITLIYKEIPFAYESELDDKANNDTLAPVEIGTTVSQAYSTGQYMMWNGDLYKVTANIANGGTITPGTNATKTTVAAELLAIISQL